MSVDTDFQHELAHIMGALERACDSGKVKALAIVIIAEDGAAEEYVATPATHGMASILLGAVHVLAHRLTCYIGVNSR